MPAFTPTPTGLVAAALLVLGMASPGTGKGPAAADWRLAPARWLMEPEELRTWRDLKSPPEATEFLEKFWRRRDPDLQREGNPNRELFDGRMEEANALFVGEGGAGGLTPRGRAYILVGPPSTLRQGYRRAPALGTIAVRGRRALETRPLLVESWSWRPEDISPALRRELEKRRWKLALLVEFEVEGGGYTLLEGEDLLRLAARSWLCEGRRK